MTASSISDIPSFLQIIPTDSEAAAFANLIVQGVEIFSHDGNSELFTAYKKSLGKLLSYALTHFKNFENHTLLGKFFQCLQDLESFPSCILCQHTDSYLNIRPELIKRKDDDPLDDITDEEAKRFYKFSYTAWQLVPLHKRIRYFLTYSQGKENDTGQEVI